MSRRGRVDLGRTPPLLVLAGTLAAALLVLPLLALLVSTPWRTFAEHLTDPVVRSALGTTALASAVTVLACLLLGTPLAWLLARVEFPGRSALRTAVTVPLVLPPVVAGVALLSLFGRTGVLGAPLAELGVGIPYTTVAVLLAHTFVALPFYVLSVEGSLRTGGAHWEHVAATLGAGRWTAVRRVTLPLVTPGVVAGAALAWARSLGEFGATITFAGNYPGTTQTMPSLIYTQLQGDPEVARTLSLVLLAVSAALLGLLRGRWLVRA